MKSKPKYELIEIARAIFHNEVFTDLHFKKGDEYMIKFIFMPLAMIGSKTSEQLLSDPPGLIFEYYTKAIKKFSINGYPCFTSCQLISIDDAKIVLNMLKQLEEFEKKFFKEQQENE